MNSKVLDTIENYNLISRGDYVIVGLSGGADSVVLLHVLNLLRKQLGFSLRAIHINHMIRGEEACRDQAFSTALCNRMSIPIDIIAKDCPAFAKKHKLSLEESARALRYEAFKELCGKEPNSKIAVAHNMNDNAETMLMRMLRGTSAYGLRGMDICRENIIRPLLLCTREEIETYALENNLTFITDSSNADLNYTRNKIRKKLIPHLKNEYNPNVISALERLSLGLKSDADYFGKVVDIAFNKYVKTTLTWAIISKNAFANEHDAITNRIIRLCVKKLNGSDKDFDNIHVNLTSNLLSLKSGKKLSLSAGLEAANCFGDIAIYKPQGKIGETPLNPGQFIELDSINAISTSTEKINYMQNWTNTCIGVFICDKITGSPVLRGRKNGDTITLQNGKTIKLKDFLIQREIPAFLRDTIYVIADGNRILMVLSDINYIAPESMKQNKNLYIQLWRKTNG